MHRALFIPLILAAALPLVAALVIWRRGPEVGASAEQLAYTHRPPGALPKLWKAPEFSYVDQKEQRVSLETFRGEPWIADFIFTTCTGACPVLTSKMVLLQRSLSDVPVRFVSFSVDPLHDLPSVLEQYANAWNASESRWSLLSTQPEPLEKTVAGFHVTVAANADPANPIVHSSTFLLVDADGWVRGAYDSDDDSTLARLDADARELVGSRLARPPRRESGDVRYADLGCGGCHANPRVAPSLENLIGRDVTLQDGTHVVADEAYVRRSILEPSAQLVAGYAPLMPSYATRLSASQVDALAAEVTAMKSGTAVAADSSAVALVTDPVCHMSVRAAPETLHVTYAGHDVYFCSAMCRDTFQRNPGKFSVGDPVERDH